MKKYFLFVGVCVIAGIMSSCNNKPDPEDPMSATPQNSIEAMRPYFPYSADQKLEFVNESTGKEWSLTPCFYNPASGAPIDFPKISNLKYNAHPEIWEVFMESDYEGEASNGKPWRYNLISFKVVGNTDKDSVYFTEMAQIEVGKEGFFQGECYFSNSMSEFIPSLKDTIRCPFLRTCATYGMIKEPAADGCYITVVKNKGITDFCIDGKTIWKRVK